ncbi:class I SAM-dependent methyltransferase [Microbacterium sp. M]|uniref:class I SAM-dependent methyltransferase n=1 Tax=Microbacterium sp. M TaxID=3377125 RepID=UPI00386A4C9B
MHDMFVRPSGVAGERGLRTMAQAGRGMALEAVALLGIDAPRARMLEIGFGPGVGLEVLLNSFSQGEVVGVDPSEASHRHAATRNAAAIARGRLHLLSGTAEALPLPDEQFDGAIFVDNLHFWPDPRAGLAEVRRVLRDGAPVVCAFTPPSGGPPARLRRLFETAGFSEITEPRSVHGSLLRAIHRVLPEDRMPQPGDVRQAPDHLA